MVQRFSVTRLNNAEMLQLVQRFIEDYDALKLKSTDEDFKRVLTRLKEQIPTYQLALKPSRTHDKTAVIREADETRDNDVIALFASIKPYRKSKKAAEQQAYTALNGLFKPYAGITNKKYEEETALINALLSKLKSAE